MEDKILVKEFIVGDKSYFVLNELDFKNNHYVFLSNKEDEKDMMVRKVLGNKLFPLDSEEEYLSVIKLIIK